MVIYGRSSFELPAANRRRCRVDDDRFTEPLAYPTVSRKGMRRPTSRSRLATIGLISDRFLLANKCHR